MSEFQDLLQGIPPDGFGDDPFADMELPALTEVVI
jgi:hypothetical protein